MLLRWVHFVAGITWVGLLYFFNLVNVPFQRELDAPTKAGGRPQPDAEGAVVVPLEFGGNGAGGNRLLDAHRGKRRAERRRGRAGRLAGARCSAASS